MTLMIMQRAKTPGPTVAGGGGGSGRYFQPTVANAELPRGVTSNNDVTFDESTQTLATSGGSSYDPVWQWRTARVGGSRHAAVNTTRTVITSGSTAWTDFLSNVTDFVAGSGDWEIKVPAAMTMSAAWTVPTVSGDRRLFVTFSGTLPTADTMPTTTALAACSVWTGPSSSQSQLVIIDGATTAKVTFTGIVIRPANAVTLGIIDYRTTGSVTTIADAPSGLVLDRCWLDGQNTSSQCRRGLACNGQQVAVLETWMTDIRYTGFESCGMGGWTCARYIYRRNVLLESLQIGTLWGGSDPNNAGSGNCDPSDILDINVACTKKSSWMTENGGNAAAGIKNGFESKNCKRWFILNCITYRHANTGQSHSMIFQTHQDSGETNSAAVAVQDIVVHNHEFKSVQNGVNILGRVAYGTGTLPTNKTTRVAVTNVRFPDLGNDYGAGGYAGNPLQLLQDCTDIQLDRFTWVMYNSSIDDELRFDSTAYTGVRWTLTNFAGRALGIFGTSVSGSGRTGLSAMAEFTSGSTYTWAGHSMFGAIQYGGTHTPGLTQYTGNGSYAADAAAMGFNTTTGVLSGASIDDGVSGTTPGVDHSQLNTALTSMQTWAYSR